MAPKKNGTAMIVDGYSAQVHEFVGKKAAVTTLTEDLDSLKAVFRDAARAAKLPGATIEFVGKVAGEKVKVALPSIANTSARLSLKPAMVETLASLGVEEATGGLEREVSYSLKGSWAAWFLQVLKDAGEARVQVATDSGEVSRSETLRLTIEGAEKLQNAAEAGDPLAAAALAAALREPAVS